MTTTLATAIASFTWAMLEYLLRGKAKRARLLLRRGRGPGRDHSGLRLSSGLTARSLSVSRPVWSRSSPAPNSSRWFGYDDALDTFGVHAVGGTLGAFLTGVFASPSVNPNLTRLADRSIWLEQLKAIGVTIALAVIGTAVIGFLVNALIGLRIAPEVERQGLDINEHGEEGYMTAG